MAKLCVLVLFLLSVSYVEAFPEPGVFHTSNTNGTALAPIVVSKTMFNGTNIIIDIPTLCHDKEGTNYTVEWMMFDVYCFGSTVAGNACFDQAAGKLKTDCVCNLIDAVEELQWMNGTGYINCDQHEYTPNKTVEVKLYKKKTICPAIPADKSAKDAVTKPGEENKPNDDGEEKNKGETQTEKKEKTQTEENKQRRKRDESGNSPGGKDAGGKDAGGKDAGGKVAGGKAASGKGADGKGADGKGADGKGADGKGAGGKKQNNGKAVLSSLHISQRPFLVMFNVKNFLLLLFFFQIGLSKREVIATSRTDGPYSVIILIKNNGTDNSRDEVNVVIKIQDSKGHRLSAADLPYRYFYLCMTILYVFFGFIWLLNMACYWRDLLRIQYFIGLVIILGFVEKVFYYSEYENVDKTGETTKTMVIVAELVAVAKKTLARALVIVVSVGFGLVKPRLGPTLHKLVAVCVVYFILASVESCLRVMENVQDKNAKNDDLSSQSDLMAAIPLALCETGIIWWVFTSLYQTIRTLRVRRNVAKLSLYRHFTNLLVFSILASLGFMIWYLLTLRFSDCLHDIRELWMEKGFWPMLFSIMLMVIMILWRPSMNSQRYSHSLLLENDEDEDATEDTVMGTKAFAAMKRPQSNGRASSRDKKKSREEKVEDDLQWIEDNIPASVADSTLQSAMNDSEEELMTTRFELSKMD